MKTKHCKAKYSNFAKATLGHKKATNAAVIVDTEESAIKEQLRELICIVSEKAEKQHVCIFISRLLH